MRYYGIWCVWLFICAMLAGCEKPGKSQNAKVLRMYAGAGLRRGVDAVVAEFTKKTGVSVEVDYGGSGMIITRAIADPQADLFMPGDVWYVNQLQNKSGSIEKRVNVALFVPTIIVEKNNPKKISELKDLFRTDVKVAIGNPDACQIGRLTLKILKKNGLEPSILHAKKSLTVNELGVWVRMRDVDAAIVWDAIAANIADNVDRVEIPKKENIISHVVIGLMKTSSDKRNALKFIKFITGTEGKNILRGKGFSTIED